MDWPWVVAIVAVVLIAKQAWKTWKSPQNQLGQQAARLGWVAAGNVKEEGFVNVVYEKGDAQALVSGRLEKVILTRPSKPRPFNDFLEVEDHLLHANDSDFMKKIIAILEGFNEAHDGLEEADFICKKVEAVLRTNAAQEMLKEQEEEGVYEFELAYRFIMNTAAKELQSGNYHVYRGLLSLAGENLLIVFKTAHAGVYHGGEDRGEMDELRKAIEAVG